MLQTVTLLAAMYFLIVLRSENLRSNKVDKAPFLGCRFYLLTMYESLCIKFLLDQGSTLLASFNLRYFLRDPVTIGIGSQHCRGPAVMVQPHNMADTVRFHGHTCADKPSGRSA